MRLSISPNDANDVTTLDDVEYFEVEIDAVFVKHADGEDHYQDHEVLGARQ